MLLFVVVLDVVCCWYCFLSLFLLLLSLLKFILIFLPSRRNKWSAKYERSKYSYQGHVAAQSPLFEWLEKQLWRILTGDYASAQDKAKCLPVASQSLLNALEVLQSIIVIFSKTTLWLLHSTLQFTPWSSRCPALHDEFRPGHDTLRPVCFAFSEHVHVLELFMKKF